MRHLGYAALALCLLIGTPAKAQDPQREVLRKIEAMLLSSPRDVRLLKMRWTELQLLREWKAALAAGEELVALDTAKADTTWFKRQIGVALQDSQPQLVLELLARATDKFPRDVRLLKAHATELRRHGRTREALAVANRVVAVDPKTDQGYATVLVLHTLLDEPDSALEVARRAFLLGDSSINRSVRSGLLGLIAPAMRRAQGDTFSRPEVQRDNWLQVVRRSATVDSMAPDRTTAFYLSYAAYKVAESAMRVRDHQRMVGDIAGECETTRLIANMVAIADRSLTLAQSFDRANTEHIRRDLGLLKARVAVTHGPLRCPGDAPAR